MEDCRRVRPELVAEVDFVEWTPENHLRHSRVIGLREAKTAHDAQHES
jgi:ATP-dependent DNA ligase